MSNKAIIAGGSLGGLMTGIVMKVIGVDAHIYERSLKVLDDRGAGIAERFEERKVIENLVLREKKDRI
jgi:2-polyprenyl-6-methoxyphenol hydroxylase-like FAD-dependent oxidoreductase